MPEQKPTPLIDIYPGVSEAAAYYKAAYKIWGEDDNSKLFANIGKLYARHAAKRIVDWLKIHARYNGCDNCGYYTISLSEMQALVALVEGKK